MMLQKIFCVLQERSEPINHSTGWEKGLSPQLLACRLYQLPNNQQLSTCNRP